MKKHVHSMVHALIASSLLASIGSPAFSQDQAVSEADRAYVAPEMTEPDLPALPATPVLSEDGYPDCREDFQKIAAPFGQSGRYQSLHDLA